MRRKDVVHGKPSLTALLQGATVTAVTRHGKQLAIVGRIDHNDGGTSLTSCVCVHLGMSGSLVYRGCGSSGGEASHTASGNEDDDPHAHVRWVFARGDRLVFRDPRRFGGLWLYPSLERLRTQRWRRLGPDALTVTANQLHRRLAGTSRCLKAALLDQTVIAGLGNIYVDELLHRCQLHPLVSSDRIELPAVKQLVDQSRRLLRLAIRAGGSTFRDYKNAHGKPGRFQHQHLVYGRSAQPCYACSRPLASLRVCGRTTVYCKKCQPLHAAAGRRTNRSSTRIGV